MSGAPCSTRARCADVLVVEDEDRLRLTILRALPEMGLTGVGASGVQEARRLLKTWSVRVLLLDIRLGASSGLEMLESLRQEGETLPAVLMTAFADVPSVQRALRCGASDYITKPFRLAQLEQALSRACKKAAAQPPHIDTAIDSMTAIDDRGAPFSIHVAKREALQAALERANGNKLQAAKNLGVSRRTLYNWLERLGE